MEKSLKEHLNEARAKRWEATSEEARKEHSAKMNAKRWEGHTKKTVGTPKTGRDTLTENGNGSAVGGKIVEG